MSYGWLHSSSVTQFSGPNHLAHSVARVWSEVTLTRLPLESLIRIPFTATFHFLSFSISWLEGLETRTPYSWDRRFPDGLSFAAFKATDDVDWVADLL